jgi:hypothetical protein
MTCFYGSEKHVKMNERASEIAQMHDFGTYVDFNEHDVILDGVFNREQLVLILQVMDGE